MNRHASETDDRSTPAAERVRLSYPADLSDWGRRTIEGEPFAAYLRRVHEAAAVGDVWSEFVGVGCCGDTRDVPLRVEGVERSDGTTVGAGSDASAEPIDEDAAISVEEDDAAVSIDEDAAVPIDDAAFVFEPREDADGGGGWSVQSRAGP